MISDLNLPMIFEVDKNGIPVHFEIVHSRNGKEVFSPARASVLPRMRSLILNRGITEAEKEYHRLKAESGDFFDFSETELNRLGYELLRAGRTTDAIRVFQLNVAAFPDAFNTYDSLAEAFLQAGKPVPALQNYRKASQLNPRRDPDQERIYQKQLKIISRLTGKK